MTYIAGGTSPRKRKYNKHEEDSGPNHPTTQTDANSGDSAQTPATTQIRTAGIFQKETKTEDAEKMPQGEKEAFPFSETPTHSGIGTQPNKQRPQPIE